MTISDTEPTVGQLVSERPGRARVFERLGIDYCCGGKRSLAEACRLAGHDPQEVSLLLQQEAIDVEDSGIDWRAQDLSKLCDHIEQTHHVFVREELPRLDEMIQRVAQRHGKRHPEMVEAQRVYHEMRIAFEQHLLKEENVLFPMIRQLEQASTLPSFHCGSIRNPIAMMCQEHDDTGAALRQLHKLTQDFTPPEDACTTYRVLFEGLKQFEADLHQHVHKENNILFPRATEKEASLAVGE